MSDEMRRTGPLDPPQYIGERLMTWEDLEALGECSTEKLLRLAEGGAMKQPLNREEVTARAINAARLLYARLLAGLIPPEDIHETERVIIRLIDDGLWPWYKNDFKCIWLAIRGCGFQPGYPLKDQAPSREQVSA
jgi:hypothetical protein